MRDNTQFYINGQWIKPTHVSSMDVINPADESVSGRVCLGRSEHVDAAVEAATAAFQDFSQWTVEQRTELLKSVCNQYKKHMEELAIAVTEEMGAPKWLSQSAQVLSGYGHFKAAIELLEKHQFSSSEGNKLVVQEPIGVCGLITPWNWPLNQIGCKLAPALATGCTVVWKPSEISPYSAHILTQVLDQAGVPKGVVNMIHGTGPEVGSAISKHPGIHMVSFTGSTQAGIAVAKDAAKTVKRVTQELGGKSPNIILDDLSDDAFIKAVASGVRAITFNSGQNCNAPSRMLIPNSRKQLAIETATKTMQSIQVGHPLSDQKILGPVVSQKQWEHIQTLIQKGIDEGAKLLTGGTGKPDGYEKGYFVKPTVFAEVDNQMQIAQQEIFGPVLCLINYNDEQEAIQIANQTPYGLSAYISGDNKNRVREIAKQIRAGMVHLNGTPIDSTAPFGGYKQSGNGRERGSEGMNEFLETKSILGV